MTRFVLPSLALVLIPAAAFAQEAPKRKRAEVRVIQTKHPPAVVRLQGQPKAASAFEMLKKRFDLDGNGAITWEEYQKVQSGFAALDTDHDGVITSKDKVASPGLAASWTMMPMPFVQRYGWSSGPYTWSSGPFTTWMQFPPQRGGMPGWRPGGRSGWRPGYGGWGRRRGMRRFRPGPGPGWGRARGRSWGPWARGRRSMGWQQPQPQPQAGSRPPMPMPPMPGQPPAGRGPMRRTGQVRRMPGGGMTIQGGPHGRSTVAMFMLRGSADANQDGTISAKEWATLLATLAPGDSGAVSSDKLAQALGQNASMAGYLTQLFDHDNNGKLEKKDLEAIFRELDRNGDGALQAGEFGRGSYSVTTKSTQIVPPAK